MAPDLRRFFVTGTSDAFPASLPQLIATAPPVELHGVTPKSKEPELTRPGLHGVRQATVELAFLRL
jgi:hypothetical protein